MKLSPQRLPAFLQKPGNCRVVLFFGEDVGLIRHRTETLIRAVAGTLDDPFLVTELRRDRLDGLAHEAASAPLTGGRRVVRVREVTDTALPAVQAVLDGRSDTLVVLEGAGLPARSKLRALLDAAPDGVAIACHREEGHALENTIRHMLDGMAVGIDEDALSWLGGQLGEDRSSTQSELEKLALYAGAQGRVDSAMAMQCIGDTAALSLDDALFAATAGDVALADRALELALAEGATPVGVLRVGLMHLQRLYRACLLVESGMSAGDAAKAARPPIFFQRVGTFTRALRLWSAASLVTAMAALSQAERNCKRTGSPDHTLSCHAVLTIARRISAARYTNPRNN